METGGALCKTQGRLESERMMWTLQNFYRSDEWREFRRTLILRRTNKEDGLIYDEITGKPILKPYDIVLHHKVELTPYNVNDINISLNPDNIVIVSHRTHNELHERWGQSQQKVYVVHGAPLSGKTRFVRETAYRDDLILDLDSIYQCIGNAERYEKSDRLKANVFGVRDCLLDMVKCRTGSWRNAYVITTEPLETQRRRLAEKLGAEIIHIDTDKRTCLKRLYEDRERVAVWAQWEQHIEDYFERFRE